MSQRPARPLRLLQSSWNMSLMQETHNPSSLLAIYKPSGLPYFAASQLTLNRNNTSNDIKDMIGSGKHLFAASTLNNHTSTIPPSDMSDSLLTRITDLLPPGKGTPRVVLPLMHPALIRYSSAVYMNALTAQRKGTTLVACSCSELMFLRNCHHLRLVRSVYRVVCRLPHCIAARVRATTQIEISKEQERKHNFKNPYIQQFLQRSSGSSGEVVDGITLDNNNSNNSNSNNNSGSIGLPRCAYPHPLLQGGFYNIKERKLLRHGTISGYLSSYKLPRSVQAVVAQQERLKSLFLSPTSLTNNFSTHLPTTMKENNCEVCKAKSTNEIEGKLHPWIREEYQMRVGLDVKIAPGKATACEMQELHNNNNINSTSSTLDSQSVVGKSFKFDFRLIRMNETCDLALYEVSTNDASEEEIKAAFAAANLFVLNDFVNDITLANSMMEVTQHLHTLPQSKLSQLPMSLQHILRQGSPMELVAEPLFTTAPPSINNNNINMNSNNMNTSSTLLAGHGNSNSESLRQTNTCGYRYTFLLEALMRLNSEAAYRRVAQLTLGSGIECAAVHFPDPTEESNIYAVQHLLLRLQEQELTEVYRASVAERMMFVSRGITDECETYNSVLNSNNINSNNNINNINNNEDNYLQIPQQEQVCMKWGNGPMSAAVRREEMSELGCVYCGKSGHVWSSCPEGLPLLTNEVRRENSASTNINNNNNNINNNINSNDNNKDTSMLMTVNMDSKLTKHTSDSMVLSTVDDVRDVIENTSSFSSTDINLQTFNNNNNINDINEGSVISIPNTAATQTFNPHAWRRNKTRPTLHQHRLRCAYCSGRHHITQCPKLSGVDSSSNNNNNNNNNHYTHNINSEKLSTEAKERLFCIKCGNYGHLYSHCPLLLPAGVQTALHCPICSLPHRKIRHTATQCPRRVSPPRDYLPSGVPAAFKQEALMHHSNNKSRNKDNGMRQRGGSGVLLSDSFLLRK